MAEKKLKFNEKDIVRGTVECKYRVHISKKLESDRSIKKELANSIVRNEYPVFIRDEDASQGYYIRQNLARNMFQKHFRFLTDKRAYLVYYKETEGTLTIDITVAIMGLFMNYGSLRETIDYFTEDLQKLYSYLLPDFDVEATEEPNEVNLEKLEKKINSSEIYSDKVLKKLTHDVTINRILTGVILFVILLTFTLSRLDSEKDETKINAVIEEKINAMSSKNEEKIKEKVESEMRDYKIEEITRQLSGVQIGDTLIIQKIKK